MNSEQRLKSVEKDVNDFKSALIIGILVFIVGSCTGCSAKAWGAALQGMGNGMKQSNTYQPQNYGYQQPEPIQPITPIQPLPITQPTHITPDYAGGFNINNGGQPQQHCSPDYAGGYICN